MGETNEAKQLSIHRRSINLLRRLGARITDRDPRNQRVQERQGGKGTEELDEVGAPINAVQLVLASIGAPGTR